MFLDSILVVCFCCCCCFHVCVFFWINILDTIIQDFNLEKKDKEKKKRIQGACPQPPSPPPKSKRFPLELIPMPRVTEEFEKDNHTKYFASFECELSKLFAVFLNFSGRQT